MSKIIQKDFLPEDLTVVLSTQNVEGCISVQVDQTKEETAFQIECAKNNHFINKNDLEMYWTCKDGHETRYRFG